MSGDIARGLIGLPMSVQSPHNDKPNHAYETAYYEDPPSDTAEQWAAQCGRRKDNRHMGMPMLMGVSMLMPVQVLVVRG